MTGVVLVNWGTGALGDSVQREHLGLAYLSASLMKMGFSVRLIDGAFLERRDDTLLAEICGEQPILVGFSLFLTNVGPVLRMAERLRATGCDAHITLGGHHATFNYDPILRDNLALSSIVRGEGEEALVELASRLHAGQDWLNVSNLAYRDPQRGVVANPCRPLVSDLDALPMPHREPYAAAIRASRVAAMVSSRGCYGSCAFCSIRSFYRLSPGKRWRMRSPSSVVDEMAALVAEHGVESIIFLDDNFLGPGQLGRRRAQAIGAELLARRIEVSWSIACRPNDVEGETLRALQLAGLKRVDLGVESFVPRQLSLYNKGVTVEQNERAVETLERLGLEYRLYVIPIDPYLTPDELLQNLAHMRRQGVAHVPSPFFNRLTAFEGTEVVERLARDGLLEPSTGGKHYLGQMGYRFRTAAMSDVASSLDRLDHAVKRAVTHIKMIFPWGSSNRPEAAFALQLIGLIGDTTLALAEQVVLAYRDGRATEAATLVDAALAEIAASLDVVEEAERAGRFARFASVEVRLGGRTIAYPSRHIVALAEALLGTGVSSISNREEEDREGSGVASVTGGDRP